MMLHVFRVASATGPRRPAAFRSLTIYRPTLFRDVAAVLGGGTDPILKVTPVTEVFPSFISPAARAGRWRMR
jgi:hypothetical protein